MRKTQLYEFHKANGNVIDFVGWGLPIWYKGIKEEHLAVRNSVGIFDVTHMGRVLVEGTDAADFLDYVTTNNAGVLADHQGHYTNMCKEDGGIIDDLTVLRLEKGKYWVVYNASNRIKNFEWLTKQSKRFKNLKVSDVSDEISMFAVQGPNAQKTLQKITEEDLSAIHRFCGNFVKMAGYNVLASRTGYTGEDGFELCCWDAPLSKPQKAIKLWNSILEAGKEFGIEPIGLGARDTLRLEAGMCLYGNDIDETTTPLEAQIGWVVKFDKKDFIGKDALMKQKQAGVKRLRVGLKMKERGIPRPHYDVYNGKEKIGHMTSGTFSPLLNNGIGIGYVKTEYAKAGGVVNIMIHEKLSAAELVKFPFYDPTKYGWKRIT
jgi:aminomethyltransferase